MWRRVVWSVRQRFGGTCPPCFQGRRADRELSNFASCFQSFRISGRLVIRACVVFEVLTALITMWHRVIWKIFTDLLDDVLPPSYNSITFLRNVGQYSPDCTASHPIRQPSSQSLPLETQTSHPVFNMPSINKLTKIVIITAHGMFKITTVHAPQ
jgi:hypothetical protein